jgi:hypothetical protein
MAAIRENVDAMSWLTQKAEDLSVAELDKGTLDVLEYRYGTDLVPEMVEHKLLNTAGVDFAGASDDQIFEATRELASEETHATESPESTETAESGDGGEFSLPSEQDMVDEIVRSLFEDSEFRAALDGQWQGVEIPSDQFDDVVEELVDMIKEGLWEGLTAAMAELGDTERVDSWTDEEIDDTLKQLG